MQSSAQTRIPSIYFNPFSHCLRSEWGESSCSTILFFNNALETPRESDSCICMRHRTIVKGEARGIKNAAWTAKADSSRCADSVLLENVLIHRHIHCLFALKKGWEARSSISYSNFEVAAVIFETSWLYRFRLQLSTCAVWWKANTKEKKKIFIAFVWLNDVSRYCDTRRLTVPFQHSFVFIHVTDSNENSEEPSTVRLKSIESFFFCLNREFVIVE